MIYVGIDIAKKAHEICFLDESGSILDGNSFKISNTASGIEKLKAKMELCGVTSDNAVVGMEATGHYWMVLHAFLLELGFDVKVINPLVYRCIPRYASKAFKKRPYRRSRGRQSS